MSAFRGGRSGGGGPPKGQFLNGVWHCDCNPRLPAVHFETKKAGPNKGRWFRSCQKPQDAEDRCKFFLWDDQAHTREQSALANNSRTEPGPANPAPTNPVTPSRRQPSPPPPYTIETNPAASIRKRTRPSNDEFDDEYGLGQVNDDDLNQAMVEAETPSKAARTTNFTTPAPKRQKLPWQMDTGSSSRNNGLQTPQTDRRSPGDNPFAPRHPTPGGALFTPSSNVDANEHHQTATPSSSFDATPTPNRFRNAVNDDIVKDVFDLLQNSSTRLADSTENELRTLLVRHAKNAEGNKRGRDVSRSTVKAKEAKITELTYRINTLEAELEAEKAMVKHLQWEAQHESDT
ncbi:uncharacterized protein J4E78_004514 [Alternaria triticimaculans]|uniref:uncharacterized protein n=1 Tax=Alternaria triticimaculans TaxID=297637 RepID=UPI0020C3B3FE|nr:uncharacterized protein J4E78_004514 [Alternaria triticimaculans]KAI4661725.1 hypothetical protein J4E78_004514 [Alternaria triticimaculans]